MSEYSYTDYAESLSSVTDYESYVSSKYTTSNCTPFPSMTKSQKVKLNEILHKEPIGYISSFDNIEIVKPVDEQQQCEPQQTENNQTENYSCCIIV